VNLTSDVLLATTRRPSEWDHLGEPVGCALGFLTRRKTCQESFTDPSASNALSVVAPDEPSPMLVSIRPSRGLVHRAPHAFRALTQHMGANHGAFHALMPQQLLSGSDVIMANHGTVSREIPPKCPAGHLPAASSSTPSARLPGSPPACSGPRLLCGQGTRCARL